jgi:hypothetical protein
MRLRHYIRWVDLLSALILEVSMTWGFIEERFPERPNRLLRKVSDLWILLEHTIFAIFCNEEEKIHHITSEIVWSLSLKIRISGTSQSLLLKQPFEIIGTNNDALTFWFLLSLFIFQNYLRRTTITSNATNSTHESCKLGHVHFKIRNIR